MIGKPLMIYKACMYLSYLEIQSYQRVLYVKVNHELLNFVGNGECIYYSLRAVGAVLAPLVRRTPEMRPFRVRKSNNPGLTKEFGIQTLTIDYFS